MEEEIIEETILEPTYEELLAECITNRIKAYKETDKFYMECSYECLPESMDKWKDAVKQVKLDYPKPIQVIEEVV